MANVANLLRVSSADFCKSPMSYSQIVAGAWPDTAFNFRLDAEPQAVFAVDGIDAPADVGVAVLDDTTETTHIVLPAAPQASAESSNDALARIVGGAGVGSCD